MSAGSGPDKASEKAPHPGIDPASEERPAKPSPLKDALLRVLHGLKTGILAAPKIIRDATIESIRGVRSPDRPTRRMARFFIVSLLGLVVTLGLFGRAAYHKAQLKKAVLAEQARLAEEKRLQAEETAQQNLPPTYQTLGNFSLELEEKSGVVKPRNAMGSAEMEIVAACDDVEVCEYLKAHTDAARGELLSLFVPTERERFLTVSGKKAFRDEIREQLNRWLKSRGIQKEITDILLPRFIMS